MRDEQFSIDLEVILGTEQGVRVFRQLVEDFGYSKTSTVLSTTGEVATQATLNNEAIRSFYCALRQHIPQDKLVLIEYDAPNGVKQCQTTGQPQQPEPTQVQRTPVHKPHNHRNRPETKLDSEP